MAAPLQTIGGLASGLDTSTIIAQLMSVERQPQIRLQQKQAVEEARQAGLRTIQTSVSALADAITALGDPPRWADTQTVDVSDPTRMSVSRTGGAAPGAYQIEVSQLARADRWSQSAGAATAAANDVLHITVGAGAGATTTDVTINAGESLDTIAGRVNGATGSRVYASVVNGAIVLANRSTGTDKAIASVTTDGGSGLGFTRSQTALDAQFSVDGTSYTRGSNTISDVAALSGLTVTLKGTTPTGSPTTVTVGAPAADTDRIQSGIQDLVSKYNATIQLIRNAVTEQKVANPQTDDDRAKGVLNGDPGLNSLLSQLREAFSDVIGGRPADMQQLAQVGLSTGKTTGSGALNQDSVEGRLTLDGASLATALATRFDDVKALFNNATGDPATQGLKQRLDAIVSPWTASATAATPGILASRLAGGDSIIASLKSEESAWDDRLATREDQLRQQFTNLETALSQAQAQGSWLSAQIGRL